MKCLAFVALLACSTSPCLSQEQSAAERAAVSRFLWHDAGPALEANHRAEEHYFAGQHALAIAEYTAFIEKMAKVRYPAEELRKALSTDLFRAHGRLAAIYDGQKLTSLRDLHLNEALKNTDNFRFGYAPTQPHEVSTFIADWDANHLLLND